MSPSKQACRTAARIAAGLLLLVLLGAPTLHAQSTEASTPGRIDALKLLETVGEDAVTVEVSLHGALLKMVGKLDPELARLVGGLESIYALVLTVESEDVGARVTDMLRRTERDLVGKKGWERLIRIKEAEGDVNILVLNDEEKIRGLVVLVLDRHERQVVFVNIAGDIDLAAIGELGQAMDLPGLDALEREGGDR